jgi:hypothetical protein
LGAAGEEANYVPLLRFGRLRRETRPVIHFTERLARSATIGRGKAR